MLITYVGMMGLPQKCSKKKRKQQFVSKWLRLPAWSWEMGDGRMGE